MAHTRRKRRASGTGLTRWQKLVKKHGGDMTRAKREYTGGGTTRRRRRAANPIVRKHRRRVPGTRTKTTVRRHWRVPTGVTRRADGRFKRKAGTRRRRAANPLMSNMPLKKSRSLMQNAPKRRRKSYRRNQTAKGIFAPIADVFSPEVLISGLWATGGAFGTLTLPVIVRGFLPATMKAQFDKVNTRLGAVGITGVSAGVLVGLSAMVPAMRRRRKEIMAGAVMAFILKAGSELIPQFPIQITAQVPFGLGAADDVIGAAIASRAMETVGFSDYDTGDALGDYDTGQALGAWAVDPAQMGDYDTGDALGDYSSEGMYDMEGAYNPLMS